MNQAIAELEEAELSSVLEVRVEQALAMAGPLVEVEAVEAELARGAGVSLFTFRMMRSLGCPVLDYREHMTYVSSLAKVAKHFGVSERTVASWRNQGMPGEPDSGYPLELISEWRMEQASVDTSSEYLFRASLRLYRVAMKRAIDRAMTDFIFTAKQIEGMNQVDMRMAAHCFKLAAAKHLDPLCLSAAEIEQVCKELEDGPR